MKYDVVIIGAGPAGVAAAHNLVNNKISCILIDKQKFPRNKVCAGGITYKAFQLMKKLKLGEEFNLESLVISDKASLYLEYKHINDIKINNKTYLVDRFEFDNYLVDSYKKKKGVILEEARVTNINTKDKTIKLSDGEKIEFKYIIGADGINGITKGIIDKNFKANGFCLQIEVDRERLKYDENNLSLYYGVIPNGYGWIFPKKHTLTIGFGGNYYKEVDYRKEFKKFLSKLDIDYDEKEIKGAFIPFGDYIENPINEEKNMLLVGDAAGLVDPITGEGIYFAMLSGIKASDIITKSIRENSPRVIEKYKESISNIIESIDKGVKLKKIIFKLKKPIFNAMKNDKVGNLILNECLFESNYDLMNTLFHKKK